MSRLTLVQLLLKNLVREIDPNRREFMSPESALIKLRELTGEDFGYDAKKWQECLKDQRRLNKKNSAQTPMVSGATGTKGFGSAKLPFIRKKSSDQ